MDPQAPIPEEKLTRALEDYLGTILELGAPVRVSAIARRLNVAKPSVTEAVKRLTEKGLVESARYGRVDLTPKGFDVACKVRARNSVLLAFLVDILGVSRATADRDACVLEHGLSAETAARLTEYVASIQNQKRKERKDSVMPLKGEMPLSNARPGTAGTVKKVGGDAKLRQRLLDMGVTAGVEIKVTGVAPLGDPIEVEVRDYKLTLRREEAAHIVMEVFG
jgi:DtxR family Mn-dependent transcriptional regulator